MSKLNIEKIEEQFYLSIEEEGLPYLSGEPYLIYEDLLSSKVDAYTSRLTLATLLANVPSKAMKTEMNADTLSAFISKECAFRKDIALEFADMYLSLLNPKQISAWREREQNGFQQLCKKDHWLMHLALAAVWQSDQCDMNCSYEADIDVSAEDQELLRSQLNIILQAHPFITCNDLQQYLQSLLEENANRDFDDFCNSDDYYEPCVDDYSDNLESDVIVPFCRKYGLKLIEVEGYGCEGEYIPNFTVWHGYGY